MRSKQYVDAILSRLPDSRLHLSTPVRGLRSEAEGGVTLIMADGSEARFDRVILACHSDEALKILEVGGGATNDERSMLGAFSWNRNEVVLHSDESVRHATHLASISGF